MGKSELSLGKRLWPWLQGVVWLVGVVMVAAQFVAPALGQALFWNGLIPVAPAVLVVASSLWRNICPLATTSLVPNRFGWSKRVRLTHHQAQLMLAIGTAALFLIIPLRHTLFDNDPRATGWLLLGTALFAVAGGLVFDRKSFWCNGLCPIHPVEKLYGAKPAFSVPNLHCDTCVNCALPCPDSLPTGLKPLRGSRLSQVSTLWMAGAFPGFIWGWFHQPDFVGPTAWAHLGAIYAWPFGAGAATFGLYLALRKLWPARHALIMHAFGAAAVSCYYFYRLPQLFGYNPMHSNDALVGIDLTAVLPGWSMPALNVATTSFFVWWLIFRPAARRQWSPRPPYAPSELTRRVAGTGPLIRSGAD